MRLRAGLLGAGLVGQVAHAFYLWSERERFELVALADASPAVRKAVGSGMASARSMPILKACFAAAWKRWSSPRPILSIQH